MGSRSFIPAAFGMAIDAILDDGGRRFAGWVLVVTALGVVGAAASVLNHRLGVRIRLAAGFHVQRLTVRHVGWLGDTLSRRIATGEVVTLSGIESAHLGFSLVALARAFGTLAGIAVVAGVLVTLSAPLGLLVLGGVPVVMVAIGALTPPLERRQQRVHEAAALTATAATDAVSGLRILRGIGGEETVLAGYREISQRLRRVSEAVGRFRSVLDGAQVLLPGLLIVTVTWLGSRFALAGRISPGELVTFYGYAVFLVLPLAAAADIAGSLAQGYVAARRVSGLLRLERDVPAPRSPLAPPPVGSPLADHDYRLTVRPGLLTGVACRSAADAADLGDRLARYVDSDVTLGGVPLRRLALPEVRRRIMLAGSDDVLFAGPLRDSLDPPRHAPGVSVADALRAASAEDIVAAHPDGLDAQVTERGRSLSGGQRQRIALARALVADPEILVLHEPTSAVDAHTEARVADGLRTLRAGRTTVVLSTSPLLLERADRVVLVVDGRVVAEHTHAALLATSAAYRDCVTRGAVDSDRVMPA
ncbi:ABC transporter ATP-binding protein [Plantactinospora sp. KLBMP9567]|uniref:ABC transporter ATP-binding protein n=1 Tax=Plantactinospora sp. KLBMP9567 TaxID=3085900 RepID=UPI0029824120|nr:ABC transporter ATP-binding protein [Plantactinospora sp. KLBMP9567]MDW5329221.1 ABC transporter ATP-binding protein [Plantactinospora sp. KLBMP9567]